MVTTTALVIAGLLVLFCISASGQPADEAHGTRIDLSVGKLFVPEGYQAGGGARLILHLHGAHSVAEENLVRSGRDAATASVVLPGLSGVYTKQFREPAVLAGLLDEAAAKLVELGICGEPGISHLTVTSFSAGFGGVREMLEDEPSYQRIDELVLADTIYSGLVPGAEERTVRADLMAGFLRFAQDAAVGRKTMVVTHTQLHTPTYASTVETADYLIECLAGMREPVDETWADGLRCMSRYQQGKLLILGFAGTTGPDHMRHLHELWRFLKSAEGLSTGPTAASSR